MFFSHYSYFLPNFIYFFILLRGLQRGISIPPNFRIKDLNIGEESNDRCILNKTSLKYCASNRQKKPSSILVMTHLKINPPILRLSEICDSKWNTRQIFNLTLTNPERQY
jgi:hypothetical protein